MEDQTKATATEPQELRNDTGGVGVEAAEGEPIQNTEEHYEAEIEEEDEDEEDLLDDTWTLTDLTSTSGDLTKQYARQRKLLQAERDPNMHKSQVPRINPQGQTGKQKPKGNMEARIDDQIASLSKFAHRIKLDDAAAGMIGKGPRNTDKADRATTELVLDPRTRMILLKAINKGILESVNGCLSTGKEANVYHAVSGELENPGRQIAIKIYKTSILVFKDRDRYVSGEYRFRHGYQKSNNRQLVKLWAEKEMRNLKRIYTAGIPSPEPLNLKLHVLFMEFLGNSEGWPSPRLKDANIPPLEGESDSSGAYQKLYIELLRIMRKMFHVCHLVHADLSEYNILYHEGKLYIIDVSQSVEHDHPRSLEFLRMDIKNISDYFGKQGVRCLSERKLYEFVTEVDASNEEDKMTERIEELLKEELESGVSDEQRGVDNEVFRQQYIPQTLEQVYDVERDAEVVEKGGKDKLVYKHLLVDGKQGKPNEQDDDDDDEEEEDQEEDRDEDEDSSVDESQFNKTPRGRKHEDKDEKKMALIRILVCILSLHLVAFATAHSAQAKLSAANAVANLLAPNSATITPAPKIPTPLQRRQNSEAISICNRYRTFLNCEGEFGTVYPLCACYTSGTFAGSYVDGLARTCSQYLFSISGPDIAAPFASFTSFCASAGDVAALLTSTIRSCESINSRDRACASESSNLALYGTLSARAACACYSGNVFSSSTNDRRASICYEKASIAGNSFANVIREYTSLCTSLGDVRASAEDLMVNCGNFETVFSSCSSNTAGFGDLPASEQASCLCYSGTDWIAAEADNAVGTCLRYASSNFQHRVSLYSPYRGLCSSAGDVRAEAQTTGGSDRPTTRP
ncbi:protein kinase rio1, partial [Orbilia oligospora]